MWHIGRVQEKRNIKQATINQDQENKDEVLYRSLRSQTCIL